MGCRSPLQDGVIAMRMCMIHSATETICEVGAMQAGSEGDGGDSIHNNDKQWMTGVAAVWDIYTTACLAIICQAVEDGCYS